ncbi:hypothetical protein HID58_070145 [Brassica napus]|uniref:Uncharacterized protein n=1 Tax=Brassica napus TaxID=3708 RepID=A0ABQ7YXX8_BRANA|nr:hypothetical protein HID58_070145 [Brassica napus]
MEGTTAMVDQMYEFLAPAMVRWKTYNCCSVDLTAVPRETSPKNIALGTTTLMMDNQASNNSAPHDKTRQGLVNTGFKLRRRTEKLSPQPFDKLRLGRTSQFGCLLSF